MIADLHADTLYECFVHGKTLGDSSLHIHKGIYDKLDGYVQNFACYIPEQQHDKWSYLKQFIAFCRDILQKDGFGLDALEIGQKRKTALLSVENCDIFTGDGSDFDKLSYLKDEQVSIISLVYNHTNAMGCGAASTKDEGLSRLGALIAEQAEHLGLILDVSHASYKTTGDILSLSSRPVLATHSNAYSITRNLRNLSDEHIIKIAQSGGLIGLNLYPRFLSEKSAGIEDIARHLKYMLNLCGEEHLALGCDFDGVECLPEGIENLGSLYGLFDSLKKFNLSTAVLEKVFYNNVISFIKDNLGGKNEIHQYPK